MHQRPLHQTATYRCDDTRGCVMQFWPPDDEHVCSKHVEAWNKLFVKQKLFCIKLVDYWDNYSIVTNFFVSILQITFYTINLEYYILHFRFLFISHFSMAQVNVYSSTPKN